MSHAKVHWLFVFGTLKQGHPNHHLNQARLADENCLTLDPYPLYLVGERYSPWLIDEPGKGYRVSGELYRVDDAKLHRMDQLERIDKHDGYQRKAIAVETSQHEKIKAQCYLKTPSQLRGADIRLGPLHDYQQQHAALYRSRS